MPQNTTVKTITEEDDAWIFGFNTRYDSKGAVEQVTEWVQLKDTLKAQNPNYFSIMDDDLGRNTLEKRWISYLQGITDGIADPSTFMKITRMSELVLASTRL